jgi:hypothetical protein
MNLLPQLMMQKSGLPPFKITRSFHNLNKWYDGKEPPTMTTQIFEKHKLILVPLS